MLDITAALKSPGTSIPFEHMEELPSVQTLGEEVTFPQPARIKGEFTLMEDALVIDGELRATAVATCARCLKTVEYPVLAKVYETFLRVDPRETEVEDPWEERLVFTGHRVDLSHLAMTLAVLDLPIRFLCAKDCAGITLESADSNQEEETLDEHPFGALKQLFTKFQEE
ncbi:MAG: DUF177 domain-containing protein [Clostridiales bacterium]|nr:DUF177 domain-containing protein [Clostridiales bacterium]